MKKSLLVFPIMALTLAGCTTYSPSAEESIPAVETVNGGWQNTDVVEQPVYKQPVYQQPVYQQPVYQQPVQVVQQPVYQQPTQVVQEVENTGSVINIPRDAAGRPDYSQIVKGSYTGDTYTVQKSDTLFFISYLAGKDKMEIARLNNLSYPYALSVGQVLRLK